MLCYSKGQYQSIFLSHFLSNDNKNFIHRQESVRFAATRGWYYIYPNNIFQIIPHLRTAYLGNIFPLSQHDDLNGEENCKFQLLVKYTCTLLSSRRYFELVIGRLKTFSNVNLYIPWYLNKMRIAICKYADGQMQWNRLIISGSVRK